MSEHRLIILEELDFIKSELSRLEKLAEVTPLKTVDISFLLKTEDFSYLLDGLNEC